MKSIAILLTGLFTLNAYSASADEFTIVSFDWGNIPSCTTGDPNTVTNPTFVLSNVPPETKFIAFKLKDKDAPRFNHGGGVVEYASQNTIEPGAFKYKSPCPPDGTHTYVWTAKAQKKKRGGKLATATASKDYPE